MPTLLDEKRLRNRAIAERFYDAYHRSVERGCLEGAFDPGAFAEEWVFASPFLRGELPQHRGPELAEGSALNHATISVRIPDYKMDDFRAWPTEAGCAWRWCVNGTGIDGRRYEFWETLFTWTDEDGHITRFEFFDDWHGFMATLAFAYDQPVDLLTGIDGYGRPPWLAGPIMDRGPEPGRPFDGPAASDAVAANAALAERLCGRSAGPADVAGGWILFSPWWGTVEGADPEEVFALAARADARAGERLTAQGRDHFGVWPTDDGFACRWRNHGRRLDGTEQEDWIQLFASTDEATRITRLEVFEDWQGFPQALGYVTGLSADELGDHRAYLAWLRQ